MSIQDITNINILRMQYFLFQDIQYDDIMAREMACSMETNIIQLCTMKTQSGGKIFQLDIT